MQTQTVLPLVIVFAITVLVYWWTNRQAKTAMTIAPGITLLKNNIIFAILGYVCAALFVGILALVGTVGLGQGDDVLYAVISLAVILPLTAYGCYYCLSFYRRHRVELAEGGLTVYDAWGRPKAAAWAEIKNAEFNGFMNEIRLYTKDGRRLRICAFLYGLDIFRAELAKHDPYLVQRTIPK